MAKQHRWTRRAWHCCAVGVLLLGTNNPAESARLELLFQGEAQLNENEPTHRARSLFERIRAQAPSAEQDTVRLIKLLPELDGFAHGELAYSLFLHFESTGDLATSEQVLYDSLNRSAVRNSSYFGYLTFGLARVRRLRGDLGASLATLDYLREQLPRISDESVAALEIEERVLVLLDLGLPSRARRSLRAFLADRPMHKASANLRLLEARVEFDRGRLHKARTLIEDLLQSTELPTGHRVLAQALLGEINVSQGQIAEGSQRFTTALRSTGLNRNARIHYSIASIHAHIALDELVAAKGEVQRLGATSQDSSQIARLASVKLQLAIKSKAPIAERVQGLKHLRTCYRAFLDRWKLSPFVEGGIGFLAPFRRRILVGELVRAELISDPKNGARAALQHILDAQACAQLARHVSAEAPSVEALQEILKHKGGGLVLFLPVDRETLVFLVDGQQIRFESAPSRADLRESAALAERALGDSDAPDLEASIELFTGALLSDHARALLESWATVRFDGLDHITQIPPALLRTQGKSWLGCAQAVATWPSSVVGVKLVNRSKLAMHAQAGAGLLGLLAPEVTEADSQSFPALTFTAKELDQIRTLPGATQPTLIFQGAQARFSKATDHRARWLWIHAHGTTDPALPRPAGIMLASEPADRSTGRPGMWPGQVEAAFPKGGGPDLAFLAACQAGMGSHLLGDDGAYPMAAAWIRAGSEAVILPTGIVHDHPAKKLATDFWRLVGSGSPPVEALQKARITSRDAGVDPREFGAFRLIGES